MFFHRGLGLNFLRFLHQGADDEGLMALLDLTTRETVGSLPFLGQQPSGLDLPAARGQLVNDRDIQIAVDGQSQGARDGRGTHDQGVRIVAFLAQSCPLSHAETVLLVNDGQGQVLETHTLLDQGMGTDDDVCFASGDFSVNLLLFCGSQAAGEEADVERAS